MYRDQLIEIINDQKTTRWQTGFISRRLYSAVEPLKKMNSVIIITGIRRCGKSTFLHQVRHSEPEQDYFLNFDDERLIHFTVEDFQRLYELFIELFGLQHTFYFDEIQNIPGWERFIRRLHDQNNKVYITGSNATMLSRELGTHLTGRYIQIDMYPFSFYETLQFNQIDADPLQRSSHQNAQIRRCYEDYKTLGGIPEYVQSREKKYLKSMYESILYRDIVARYHITHETELRDLIHFCASNAGKAVSFASLGRLIHISSSTTVKDYLGYLENAYFLFLISRFDWSVKKSLLAPKKMYMIDNALALSLGTRISSDQGRLLENLVFLQLKRMDKTVFYHQGTRECDFVIHDANQITEAIQVTVSLAHPETRDREIQGLTEAMDTYSLDTGLILTEDEQDELTLNGKKISVYPTWRWLIESGI